MQLQLQKLDTQMMADIEAEKRAQQGNVFFVLLISLFTWLLALLGVDYQKSLEETVLPVFVQKKMEPMLQEMLIVKMEAEMKVDAEINVVGDDKQARYFFTKLKDVRAAAKKGT